MGTCQEYAQKSSHLISTLYFTTRTERPFSHMNPMCTQLSRSLRIIQQCQLEPRCFKWMNTNQNHIASDYILKMREGGRERERVSEQTERQSEWVRERESWETDRVRVRVREWEWERETERERDILVLSYLLYTNIWNRLSSPIFFTQIFEIGREHLVLCGSVCYIHSPSRDICH